MFLNFSLALVGFGVVLVFIGGLPNGPVVPWVPLLVALAVVSVVGVRIYGRTALSCESAGALAASYRNRFFVTIALTESVALFGFVFTFIGGPVWIYDAGAAFALIRFWSTAAPTRSALLRDQETLNAGGCGLSLIAALRGTPPPTGRWTWRPE